MFEIQYIDNVDEGEIKEQLWNILCECNHDFFPPLSHRESSSQGDLKGIESRNSKPELYFDEMIKQNFIIVKGLNNKIIGFMTFKHGYICEELKIIGESNYITTICVTKAYRKQGILKIMYKFMATSIPNDLKLGYISTRTWSTNAHHIHTLEKTGFNITTVLKDHRGKDIDTIYFGKKV